MKKTPTATASILAGTGTVFGVAFGGRIYARLVP